MKPEYRGERITGPWGEPWLVQRLEVPDEYPEGSFMHGKDNPFAFGGGMKNGGLSDEAMGLLRPIFAFDYMGAAEFEFGAVANAFSSMVKTKDEFDTLTFKIPLSKVPYGRMEEKYFVKPEKGEKKEVYVLAKRDHLEPAKAFILSFLRKKGRPRLKEWTGFEFGLLAPKDLGKDSWNTKIRGWLDIDNCLLWFTDKTMFEKMRDLLLEVKKETAS